MRIVEVDGQVRYILEAWNPTTGATFDLAIGGGVTVYEAFKSARWFVGRLKKAVHTVRPAKG